MKNFICKIELILLIKGTAEKAFLENFSCFYSFDRLLFCSGMVFVSFVLVLVKKLFLFFIHISNKKLFFITDFCYFYYFLIIFVLLHSADHFSRFLFFLSMRV